MEIYIAMIFWTNETEEKMWIVTRGLWLLKFFFIKADNLTEYMRFDVGTGEERVTLLYMCSLWMCWNLGSSSFLAISQLRMTAE